MSCHGNEDDINDDGENHPPTMCLLCNTVTGVKADLWFDTIILNLKFDLLNFAAGCLTFYMLTDRINIKTKNRREKARL